MPAFALLASLEDTFVSHNLCGVLSSPIRVDQIPVDQETLRKSSSLEKGFQTYSQVHVVLESVEQSYLIDEDSC